MARKHRPKPVMHSFAISFDTKNWTNESGVEIGKGHSGVDALLHRKLRVPKAFFERLMQLKFLDWQGGSMRRTSNASSWSQRPKSIFGLPMIDPCSKFTVVWKCLIFFIDFTYTAFGVPLACAFCLDAYGDPTDTCTQIELVFGCVYVIHLLLEFQTGALFICGIKRMQSLQGGKVARAYILHGHFLEDLAAAVPLLVLVGVIISQTIQRWALLLTLIRMIRLLRFFSLSRIVYLSASSNSLNHLFKNVFGGIVVTYVFMLIFIFAIITNLLACMLLVAASFDGYENSWLVTITWLDAVEAPPEMQWYMAIYLCICTFTNTGSWGITPMSFGDMAVMNIIMVMGMVVYGVLLGSTIALVTKANPKTLALYRLIIKMQRVKRFIAAHQLPQELAMRLQEFYKTAWWRFQKRQHVHSMREIPPHLRSQAVECTLGPLGERMGFLGSLNQNERSLLDSKMVAVDVEADTDLGEEGDEPRWMWVLEEGEVRVLSLRAETHRTLTPPAMFGDAIILSGSVQSCRDCLWGYQTVTHCRLWRLDFQDLMAALRVCPSIGQAYLSYIQSRLMQMLTQPSIPEEAVAARSPAARSPSEKDGQRQGSSTAPAPAPAPAPDNGEWCELVARITLIMEHMTPDMHHEAVLQLQQAQTTGEMLQLLLDALLEISTLGTVHRQDCLAALSVCSSYRSMRATVEQRLSDSGSIGDGDDDDVYGEDGGGGGGLDEQLRLQALLSRHYSARREDGELQRTSLDSRSALSKWSSMPSRPLSARSVGLPESGLAAALDGRSRPRDRERADPWGARRELGHSRGAGKSTSWRAHIPLPPVPESVPGEALVPAAEEARQSRERPSRVSSLSTPPPGMPKE